MQVLDERSVIELWKRLPEDEQQAAEAAACRQHNVADFFDLTPAQRREARAGAVSQ